MPAESDRNLSREFLGLLLRPIARYCIRHSQSIQDLINVAKVVFVQVAEEEIKKDTERVNASRLSIMTGVHRKDVAKIFQKKETPAEQPPSELWRVVGHWEQSPAYRNKQGLPKILTYRGTDSEFRKLVAEVTKHTDPGTILFELERINMIEKSEKGIRLIQPLPRIGTDIRRGFEIISHDIENLLAGAEENVLRKRPTSNLHISTEYDNIFVNDIPVIRKWLINEGKEFHRKIRDYLSKFDSDITPDHEQTGPAGARVTVGSFSFTSTFPDPTDEKAP